MEFGDYFPTMVPDIVGRGVKTIFPPPLQILGGSAPLDPLVLTPMLWKVTLDSGCSQDVHLQAKRTGWYSLAYFCEKMLVAKMFCFNIHGAALYLHTVLVFFECRRILCDYTFSVV